MHKDQPRSDSVAKGRAIGRKARIVTSNILSTVLHSKERHGEIPD